MGLLDKVRVLVGALVHRPFSPRRETVDLPRPVQADASQEGASLPALGEEAGDTERVADLIAQRKQQGRDPQI